MDELRHQHTAYRTQYTEPVSFVPAVRSDDSPYALPDDAKQRLVIDVIHDGEVIPEELLFDADGVRIPEEVFLGEYERERDWGAALLAQSLVELLGLDGFWNVEIARVVMDFGRFPGITAKDADYQSRHAINYPFSEVLDHSQKRRILEHYYDAVSACFNEFVASAQVSLAIHTYDTFNQSGTRRPPASVLTRCVGYQVKSEMPFGVFDPLYPDILGQFTSDRILRDRVSLTLERAGIHTEHNYPYLLPDGSVEVRSQVWSFFHITRREFEAEHPDTRSDPAFSMVWRMLLDTNLRSSDSELLRGYLHAFRRVPRAMETEYAAARRAYEEICEFVRRDDHRFVEKYRLLPDRPSALAIEVRKDLLFEFDASGRPVAPKPEAARDIASVIAHALHIYFTEDCPDERVQRVFQGTPTRG
ncbi:MAG: hypothetical protein Tsb0020_23510 [Haliangiales bacterium]